MHSALLTTNVSSINLSQILGGLGEELKALASKSFIRSWPQWGLGGFHGSSLYLFVIHTLECEEGTFEAEF